MKRLRIAMCSLVLGLLWATARANDKPDMAAYEAYSQVVEKTAGMVGDSRAWFFSRQYGMHVLPLTWEDTGRYYNSSVGPNISDVTIQVQQQNPKTEEYDLSLMPVIRFPNFSDKTVDIPLEEFYLLVGNHSGQPLKKVNLREYLGNLRKYLTKPESWNGDGNSLLAARDTHAMVSAQACFLPIAEDGQAEFNPVIFNYQSSEKNPAVLTILGTREGTSATVIDNKRDAIQDQETFLWGQRLFFNDKGQRASLTGRRKSDYDEQQVRDPFADKSPEISAEAAGQKGLNMVLLIQVPLKHKELQMGGFGGLGGIGGMGGGLGGGFFGGPGAAEVSDVEEAVIGHGKVEGPFTEIDDLKIERDERFPVRVTVQFYKGTSNGVISAGDMAEIADQINRVYKDRKYVGSLVLGGPSDRPTEYDGDKVQPPWWWNSFWDRYEKNTGINRWQAIEQLMLRIEDGWHPRSRRDMVNALRNLPEQPKLESGSATGKGFF